MEINPLHQVDYDRKLMYAKKPKVLIVGAGMGGLTLGILLQKADIPYDIFERAFEVKPLGAGMSFSASTAFLFQQLGIYDEFASFGKLGKNIKVVNEAREHQYTIDLSQQLELFGAEGHIVSRPMIYDLLFRQVPKERIHLGKKVLSTDQGGNGVLIRCSDGTIYEGDILVGADGAYSAVRQSLYANLKKKKQLPASDDVELPFSTVCLVGQTRPLDVADYPLLAEPTCQFFNCFGDNKPYSWSSVTTKQNTICWRVVQYLDEESSKDNDAFRNSEWGPEAAGAMCKEVRHFPIVSGGDKFSTIGDLIDSTPKELISKVMLEEKVFKTWYNCRTVLIGDACHKFNPAGGLGATNAIHDAIVLANLINALPEHPTHKEIEKTFKAYKRERLSWVNSASNSSKAFRTMTDASYKAKLVRYCAKNMPAWAQRHLMTRMGGNRPQVAFLPQVKDTGSLRPSHQPSLTARRAGSEKEAEQSANIV
ncbi:hypothetical protein BGX29_011244 [Mortierella sp. GBA35]|nr:hypothetical protein BGX29_011244 [Mortierella sp. GBA35]